MKMNKIEAKRELYKKGSYSCAVPPVCSNNWNIDDWINWIDKTGKFNFELNGVKWTVEAVNENKIPLSNGEKVQNIKIAAFRVSQGMKIFRDFEIDQIS